MTYTYAQRSLVVNKHGNRVSFIRQQISIPVQISAKHDLFESLGEQTKFDPML